MRSWPGPLSIVILLGALPLSLARATPEQDYLQIYLAMNEAESNERSGDFENALTRFEDCYCRLRAIHLARPRWEDVMVTSRLEDCRAKILELELTLKEGVKPGPAGNPASGSLASACSNPPALMPPVIPFLFPAREISPSCKTYPWKNGIVTTVFWIGEDHMNSSWDSHWVHDNGGGDHPDDMSGYASSQHATTLNPFYVALPFNDLPHPELAEKWLPESWKAAPAGSHVSACKDRWIEIKNRAGRYCYAQWEDVSPGSTGDAAYVFGSSRPSTERGLNVSPAVAKYLGFDSSAMTSWRFVDDENVLPGMWLRYDEQAILFRAIHEQKGDKNPSSSAGTN